MGISQLLITTNSRDAWAATRPEIRRGPLRSTFLKGPARCTTSAGFQPAGSGPHYTPGLPIIVQFSPEILSKILGNLDPIWLFQVESAVPQVREFLQSPAANKVWYDAIPGALMLQPDYFQSEEGVAETYQHLQCEDSRYNWSRAFSATPTPITSTDFSFPEKRDPDSHFFTLPRLGLVSELWKEVEAKSETTHPRPSNRNQYPFVKPTIWPVRKRNLAIGGPFDPSINYRRELLGHLHDAHRCYLCFESFQTWRQQNLRFGMLVCDKCDAVHIVTIMDMKEQLPGLSTMLNKTKHGIWTPSRLRRGRADGYWLPQLDDILRKSTVGLDYNTTVTKRYYMHQIWNDMRPNGMANTLYTIRQRIVAAAQVLWTKPAEVTKDKKTALLINRLRESIVPTTELGRFLFPPRLLSEDGIYVPQEIGAVWPKDPTDKLENLPDAKFALDTSTTFVSQAASKIILDLIADKSNVTALTEAADKWHAKRLRDSFAGILAHPLGTNGIAASPQMDVILAKLHLVPDQVTAGVTLTTRGQALAMAVLPKILEDACIVCPKTKYLSPRGLYGMIGHMRTAHPDIYWYTDWSFFG